MKPYDFIIVGGGVAGLLSALYLGKENKSVLLIDGAKQLGGLLGRAYHWEDYSFDFGTHFLSSTGDEAVDTFLFGTDFIKAKQWLQIPLLKAGHFYNGKLNEYNQPLSIRGIDADVYKDSCFELMHKEEKSTVDFKNLEEQLLNLYGKTITKHVFEPILDKFFKTPSCELSPNAQRIFGLDRITVGSDLFIHEVKKSAIYDDIISYAHRENNASSLKVFYPEKGIGEWIDTIVSELQALPNVTMSLSTQIKNIDIADNNSVTLTLNSNQSVSAQKIIWTVSSKLLSDMLGLEKVSLKNPMRNIDLYHFVLDKPLETDLHFFYCYDPNVSVFRVTLYPQLQTQSHYAYTVEVMREEGVTLSADDIFEELGNMGIVADNTKCIHQHYQPLNTGFPKITTELTQYQQSITEKITADFPQIIQLGREMGKGFFMRDVLVDVYYQLENMKETDKILS